MSCVLRLSGTEFNVDDFVAISDLHTYKIWHKGEPLFRKSPEKGLMIRSGLTAMTSNAGFEEYEKQVEETIEYLKENKTKLSHILTTKEIEYATLDFGINLWPDKLRSGIANTRFPNELLRLAGELGLSLELSEYLHYGEDEPE